MGYTSLKAALDAVVRTNGQQQITGANLNDVMTTILQGVDVLDRANPADTSGMNKVVLKKNKTFAEQVTGTNTIYEIRDNFTLSADFTIPDNSVLFFMGGSIDGSYTLNLNNCKVMGTDRWIGENLSISGKTSTYACADWFADAEDYKKIERAISTFHVVFLSAREYTITQDIAIRTSFALFGASIPDFASGVNDCSQTRLIANGCTNILQIGKTDAGSYLSFVIENVSFSHASRGANGVMINTYGGPSRPCVIRKCNFKFLNKAISCEISASTTGAVLTIEDCNINLNNYGVFGAGTSAHINLCVRNNNLEQNMTAGIHISNDDTSVRAHGAYCVIENNNMEGQPLPIFISSSGFVRIYGDYFESTDAVRKIKIIGQGYTRVEILDCFFSTRGSQHPNESALQIEAERCVMRVRTQQINFGVQMLLTSVVLEECDLNLDSVLAVAFPEHFDRLFPLTPVCASTLTPDWVHNGQLCLFQASTAGKLIRNASALSAGKYRLAVLIEPKQQTNASSSAGGYKVQVKPGSDSIVFGKNIPSTTHKGKVLILCDFELASNYGASAVAITLTNTLGVDCYVYGAAIYDPTTQVKVPLVEVKKYGTFSTRPTLDATDIGESYFNTSTGKMEYWNGSAWVDATGAAI